MISIIGAGKSSIFLIQYLVKYCQLNQLSLKVFDREITPSIKLLQSQSDFVFENLDLNDGTKLDHVIQSSRIVVSMLPANLHFQVALKCLDFKVHLATASYISDEMKALHEKVKSSNLIFLNEMGLDPGIDHMSAMKIMDELKLENAKITSFESYCGGLIADEDDGHNPWKYKFSWNPRNVVLAAQGAPAQYYQNSNLKLKPYHKVFQNVQSFDIKTYGRLEAYANRDSVKYIDLYGLKDVVNMIRGTFRKPGFCEAWQVFVELGMTDNVLELQLPPATTLKKWMKMYLPPSNLNLSDQLNQEFHFNPEIMKKLEWLGFFYEDIVPIHNGTAAQILEELLKEKWMLKSTDKDLVVMLHRIQYLKDGVNYLHESEMVLKGHDGQMTAMAKTVGLPLAIGCKMIIENKIKSRGVLMPSTPEIYIEVLKELAELGIDFKDSVTEV